LTDILIKGISVFTETLILYFSPGRQRTDSALFAGLVVVDRG
jgi:hypothetical protein